MADYKQFISDLITEVSYRTTTGIVDFKNPDHISILSEVLDEIGLTEIKHELFENLFEADKRFSNPILNREIEYTDAQGNKKTGLIGNLLRNPEESPGRQAAERQLPPEGSPEREKINQELGSEKDGKTEKPTPSKGDDEDSTQQEPQLGMAVKPNTKAGKSFTDNLPKDDVAYTGDDGDSGEDSDDTTQSKTSLLKQDHDITDEQLNMTKSQAAAQAKQKGKKDVGAGTAESRAGEAMVHKGLRMISEGGSIEEVEKFFTDLVNSNDHILNSKTGKKWVGAALASIRKIDEVIGIENIQDVSWDTPQGRTAIGVDPNLETSADMFVRTKDGRNIGISLKKDGKVFLNNGGWAKQSKILLGNLQSEMPAEDHERLSEAMSIEAYKKDLEDRFIETTNIITADQLRESFERLKNNPDDQKEFQGSNRDRYFSILSNPEILIEKIRLGTANGVEQKAYSKLLQTYHKDQYDYLRESDNGLTQRAFDVLNTSEEAKKGMNRHIIKSMHIMETIGLNEKIKSGGVDGFMTMYGIEPDGATLNEDTLITLLGKGFKQKLDEKINEVRNGDSTAEELEEYIINQIEIDYDSGEILFKHESNKKYPLFKLAGRTRGIGSSPVMEMVQTPFMAHALKMGTFNTDEWDSKSLSRFEKDIQDSDED